MFVHWFVSMVTQKVTGGLVHEIVGASVARQ